MQNELLTLGDYLAVIRRRFWLVALATVLLAGAGYAYAKHKPTSYTATAQVSAQFVQAPNANGTTPPTSSSPTADARYLANLATTARSTAILSEAAKLGQHAVKGLSASALASRTTVTPSTTSDVLEFTASAQTPSQATALATAYATAYVDAHNTSQTLKTAGKQIKGWQAQVRTLYKQIQNPSLPTAQAALDRQSYNRDEKLISAWTAYVNDSIAGTKLIQTTAGAAETRLSTTKYALGGALAGFVLGLICAFVWDALDTRARSGDQIAETLGLPVLANLPTPPRELRQSHQLVMMRTGDPRGEPFRILAARLELLLAGSQKRTILVTSALDGEGKSTSAANLAVALSQKGRSAVLVDGDLVRPTAARFFGLDERQGFSDVLAEECTLESVLVPVPLPAQPSPAGKLTVVPPGKLRADVSGLLADDRLQATFHALAERADYVIVDSPPLLSVSHAIVISAYVDAILVVARVAELKTSVVTDLTRALGGLPAPTLGVAVTGADHGRGYGYGYGYGYGAARPRFGGLRRGRRSPAPPPPAPSSLREQPQSP